MERDAPDFVLLFCLNQLLIHLHECRNAGAFRRITDGEAIGLHNRLVVLLVCAAQFRRHGAFIIQVSKAVIGVQISRIQNRLRRLLDFRFLFVGWRRPREVVVDNIV